jgi:hypothetical protein
MENEMKVLKIALVACSLSAAVAQAQTAPAAAQQQVTQSATQTLAQADVSRVAGLNSSSRRVDVPKTKAQTCVGPVSFCTLYFGS